ncbi:hypothetical protein DCC85_20260 [Paenibacillus sp. CAA11]|uniref:M23 family metallopeptidase n=1 Tax=Paenibacillus sp. CAA11 TaxID=1532905 RepID=UPI000D3B7CE4|nr:M23 family metallopeptidase [Paenibacillus sp. CAA11]AWB46266.1 hypothetical protein DCC85_20260 [Paenibacillus sp. CAA11]
MNEQKNKQQLPEESPKKVMGEPVAPVSSWKKLLSKRWIYPAAYVAAAAIILTLVWVYQDTSRKPLDDKKPSAAAVSGEMSTPEQQEQNVKEEEKAVETTAATEDLAWPVANAAEVKIVKPFYESDGTSEEHVAAMIEYKDTFRPNTGIDLSRADKQSFEVKASLGGKVTRVEQHPLLGNLVEVTNANNLKTVYASLADVKVKLDDQVKQGDTIAKSGQNELGKDLGSHLHFAVYENGAPVNPASLLPQQ